MPIRSIIVATILLGGVCSNAAAGQDPRLEKRAKELQKRSFEKLEKEDKVWKSWRESPEQEQSMELLHEQLAQMDQERNEWNFRNERNFLNDWNLLNERNFKKFKLAAPELDEVHWKRELGDRIPSALGRGLPEPPRDWQEGASPGDTLYRRARETLNRGEYRQASELFHSFAQRYPNSRYVPAAMYWEAFSLHRAGTENDLRQALRLLDDQKEKYPTAADEREVSNLMTRIVAALAARGDNGAAARLRQVSSGGAQSCDREDMEVRAEALSALVQSDPATAGAALRRILARKDECSVALRRRAVYLIGREGIGGGVPELLEVAKNDPDIQVRTDAISRLAQMPGAAPALEQLFTSASDEAVQRSVLQAVRFIDGPEASRILRRAIEREDLPESVRVEAVRSFARGCCSREKPNENRLAEGDASYLRAAYEKNASRNIKAAILETLARTGGPATDQWLLGIVKNGSEDIRYRTAALTRLQRSDVSVEELAKLYDALTERELRSTLVEILGVREEAAATDKLFDIVRTGTDPTIRRRAIGVLARKKDPRTTKLLLELVEK